MSELWDRDELYQEIWKEPVTTVAKRYGVSGNAIAKVCRKLQIPAPGRGYWAKKAEGHSVEQIPLPPIQRLPRLYKPTPTPPPKSLSTYPGFELIDERLRNGEFDPSNVDSKCSVSLEGARKAMHLRRKQSYQGDDTSSRADEFDLRVSKGCVDRAINLLGCLIGIAKRIGASVQTTKRDYKTVTTFVHQGIEVQFCIRERLKMNKHRSLGTSSTGYSSTFEPTGTLAFEILEYVDSAQKLWQDKMHMLIETQVSTIIAGLMKAASLLRRRADERKKQELLAQQHQLRLQELARQVNQEEERVKKLINDSQNCKLAKTIREYLSELATCDPAVVPEANPQYLKWAKEQADRIDPLRQSPPSVLDRRNEVEHRLQKRW